MRPIGAAPAGGSLTRRHDPLGSLPADAKGALVPFPGRLACWETNRGTVNTAIACGLNAVENITMVRCQSAIVPSAGPTVSR